MLNRLRRRARPWPDDSRWNTRPVNARVLAVTRTLTSATRVLDVLTLLRGRDGISFYVTVNPGSAFTAGLDAYLHAIPGNVTVMPWDEAVRHEFDLAVACAVHASMHQLHAPLVVLPHGAGYNRLVTESTGDTVSAAGLSRKELTHKGRVFPAVIGVTHPEQRRRLGSDCPEALPRAREVGDLCFDRMHGSTGSRDRYRERLGAVDGRRLVVVNSTWSEHSLLAQAFDLPIRLVRQLPADEYTVAVILHPNVWAFHDPESVLARATRAGLRLIPPHRGWQATVVAADCMIGDHGSVSFYGAALEHPTVLVATGAAELDPRSPTYAFGQAAPTLDPDGDLLSQLGEVLAAYDPADLRPITDLSLGSRDRAAQILTDVLYDFLTGVDQPAQAPTLPPYPDPVPLPFESPTGYDVEGECDGTEVSVRRYPIVDPEQHQPRGLHVVSAEEPVRDLKFTAEALARTTIHAERSAEAWLADASVNWPGATVLVAALGKARHLLRLPTGLLLEAHTDRSWGVVKPRLDPLLLGAALALWLADSGEPTGLPHHGLTIRTGRHRVKVTFTPRPD
ncbi:hypothetical protein DR950_13265 [Kitasatospora xanthocidica]|uniref:Translation initiation factor 2 n=1 Tax=Kitasatospora xanthocidica TaxID=83382 RepID=A0A372ZTM9_9ACTN|nr:hypothetical protein [Kitasatospora xanthocidica]RGD58627.1 hypothetical protein DR950_13265 [Kitasatospora xanthocidica]